MAVTIVGLAFLVTGIAFVWIATRMFARHRAVVRWPRADGVVTSARLQSRSLRVTDKNTGLHSYGTYYTPEVRYTYTVGGETFEGTSIARAYDSLTTSHDAAKRIIDRYPADARVAVVYDPANPKTAHLEVGRPIGAILVFAIGGISLGVGTLVLTLTS